MASVQNVNFDAKLLVLERITDLPSLGALLTAEPSYAGVFAEHPHRVLLKIHANEQAAGTPSLLPDALALLHAQSLCAPGAHVADVHALITRFSVAQRLPSAKKLATWTPLVLGPAAAGDAFTQALLANERAVAAFVASYAARRSAAGAARPDSPAAAPLSARETLRLYRGFYRFFVYAAIAHQRPPTSESDERGFFRDQGFRVDDFTCRRFMNHLGSWREAEAVFSAYLFLMKEAAPAVGAFGASRAWQDWFHDPEKKFKYKEFLAAGYSHFRRGLPARLISTLGPAGVQKFLYATPEEQQDILARHVTSSSSDPAIHDDSKLDVVSDIFFDRVLRPQDDMSSGWRYLEFPNARYAPEQEAEPQLDLHKTFGCDECDDGDHGPIPDASITACRGVPGTVVANEAYWWDDERMLKWAEWARKRESQGVKLELEAESECEVAPGGDSDDDDESDEDAAEDGEEGDAAAHSADGETQHEATGAAETTPP